MLKVAMLSYWHVHAWDYTREVQKREDCKIVAVWDEIPERGQQAAEQLGAKFYASLQELLADPEVEAVVCDAPSNMHAEVMIAAAKAGKHVFTEKVLAITTKEADQIIEAVKQAGVKFMISLVRLSENRFLYAKKIVEAGLVGQISLMRVRMAHDGALPKDGGWLPAHFYNKEQTGGGALIDLGCHPMYLSYYLLGLPKTVSATFGHITGRQVEDNAVSVLGYEDGAIAVVEAGFSSKFSPFSLEVYGTEGAFLSGATTQLTSTKLDDAGHKQWTSPEAMPDHLPSPLNQWVDEILYGKKPPIINIDYARALTQLMEASNRSVAEGRTITL